MFKLVICFFFFLQAAVAFIPSSLPSSSTFNLNLNLAQSTTSRHAGNKGRLYMMDGNVMTLNRFMMDHVREKSRTFHFQCSPGLQVIIPCVLARLR